MNSKSIRGAVAVLGQGYVGLPLSIAATQAGWKVIGLDTDSNKVRDLSNARSHIEDVTFDQLSLAIEQGLTFSSDMSLISECEIIIICVPTPLDINSNPDLSMLNVAIENVSKFARHQALLVNESTSYPSTTRDVIAKTIMELSPNLQLLYAVAPERVDPGNLDWTYERTPRLVSGLNPESIKKAVEFYSSFCETVISVEKPEVVEFAKVLENSFRQVNIALVNELTPLASKLGISMFDVVEAAASKPYGYMPFWPGVGVGGHCIPVDPMYLSWFARQNSLKLQLIDSAQAINSMQPSQIARLISQQEISEESRILIVGIAYKAGTKDLRESPSLELLKIISAKYSNVEWWDESITSWNGTVRSKLDYEFDLVVVTHPNKSEEVSDSLKRAKKIIDCTGKIRGLQNTISI